MVLVGTISGSDITEGKIKKARLPSDSVYSADARLADARTPTAHTQAASTITDFSTAADARIAAALAAIAPVDGAVTYGTGWRTPTTQPQPPLTLTRTGTEVTLRGGSIENSVTLTLGANGQAAGAFTIPATFRPGFALRIPAMVSVTGATLASAQIIVNTNGSCAVQTTTGITSAAAGDVSFAAPTARWIATS